MITLLKLTAAALLALTTAGLSYLAVTTRVAAATLFAETIQKIQQAHTLAYRFTVQVPGQKQPTIGREYYKDPGLSRMESESPQAVVTVTDLTRGKVLSLDPANRLALLQDWKPPAGPDRRGTDPASETLKHLRSLAARDEKPVGRRKIGDIEAQGFRVEENGIPMTVWVDPARKFPLQIEITYRFREQDVPATMSDFQIDPPLDDSLFRLDPPEGYTLRKLDVPIPTREEALVNLLRAFAEASGGTFPPRPDDPAAFQKQFPKEKWKGPDDPAMIRLVQAMAASAVFLQFELKNAYGYAPDGVKLGDADRILFWYHPRNSPQYRAIFGDLHIEDVPPDRLPEKPKF